ncbi:MAG: hypothetical protein AB2L13_10605 [Spirochaetota bacterium]
MEFRDEIAALKKRAAELREESLSWITVDGTKGRRLLEVAEKLEERVVLLECASRVGAPATHRPFQHWNGARREAGNK